MLEKWLAIDLEKKFEAVEKLLIFFYIIYSAHKKKVI